MTPFSQLESLIQFRHKLHSIAELSGEERETAIAVVEQLLPLNPSKIVEALGGYGLLVEFDHGVPGATVMFRAELDALPIPEVNEFVYKSKHEGVSHKCGHDGHTTILVGLAEKLLAEKPIKGKLQLLFQPAEETGEGAALVLQDERFKEAEPDYVFALHNIPNKPKGKVISKAGSFNASVISLAVHFFGVTSHAAEPENGINPDLAIAALITQMKNMANSDKDSDDFMKVATVYTRIGSEDYGISAGEGEVHFTIRCWTNEALEKAKQKIELIVMDIASHHHLAYEQNWMYEFKASRNDEKATSIINKAAQRNQFELYRKKYPFAWGEDFGGLTEPYKGAMFGLGAGIDMPALHNPDYDFPDDILPFGVDMFYEIFQLVQENAR